MRWAISIHIRVEAKGCSDIHSCSPVITISSPGNTSASSALARFSTSIVELLSYATSSLLSALKSSRAASAPAATRPVLVTETE